MSLYKDCDFTNCLTQHADRIIYSCSVAKNMLYGVINLSATCKTHQMRRANQTKHIN